jgi:hypothetical protein
MIASAQGFAYILDFKLLQEINFLRLTAEAPRVALASKG